MVSQFVSCHDVRLLSQITFPFPEGTHAIGRLDNNSEGLLILTTNKKLTRLLFEDTVKHERKYLVEINNEISEEDLLKLQTGISFKIKGGNFYQTLPCKVLMAEEPHGLFSNGIIRYQNLKTTWLYITLTEGKYHQVRKMIGSIKHRCLRLIRVSISNLQLGNLQPGDVLEMREDEIFAKLGIKQT